MPWQRSELPPASTRLPAVPASDALRQAALQASWQRDRRVAQRRIAWRWLLWYLQRYSLPALASLGLVGTVAYFLGGWPERVTQTPPSPPSSVIPRPAYTAPSVPPPRMAPQDPVATGDASDPSPLTLRASTRLTEAPVAASPETTTTTSADTLSLKPETWLHSKEP
jgi:hypothetical protein